MNNRVDKVFKDKLESHQLSPSPAAWDKLDQQLAKKNNAHVWLRAAAVLALVSLATVVAINWRAEDTQNNLASNEEVTPAQPAPTPNETPEQPVAMEPAVGEQVARKQEKKKVVVAPQKETPVVDQQPIEQQEEQPVVLDDAPALIVDATPVPEQIPDITETIQEEKAKPVVIVYTLPAIAKNEAPQPEEKKTGFQRVLEVANNVKNADNPFGELREAKNDLFAWEFRRDKDKNKNNN